MCFAGGFADTHFIKKGSLHTADYQEGDLKDAGATADASDLPPPKIMVWCSQTAT